MTKFDKNPLPAKTKSKLMMGRGIYNDHSAQQKAASMDALSLFQHAAQTVQTCGNSPILIVDYGSAQGKNSLIPIGAALNALKPRLEPQQAVIILHNDQENNDFCDLFGTIHHHPESYNPENQDKTIFSWAVGQSFFEMICPENSVTLGWSSIALHWLSRDTTEQHWIHSSYFGNNAAIIKEIQDIAAEDWKNFLSARNKELKPGGQLVLAIIGQDENGKIGFEEAFNQAESVLDRICAQNIVTAQERAAMHVPYYARSKAELLAPFSSTDTSSTPRFGQLILRHLSDRITSDAFEEKCLENHDLTALADRRAMSYHAIMSQSLFSALDARRSEEERQKIITHFLEEFRRDIKAHPIPLRVNTYSIRLEKQDQPSP